MNISHILKSVTRHFKSAREQRLRINKDRGSSWIWFIYDQCSGSQRVRQGIFKNIYLTNIFYVAVRLFGNLIIQDT